jgi:4-hydroxythreonine-4-phosphate dehydrogenase
VLAITMGDPAGSGPRSSPRRSAGTELTRGCFVAGDVACMRRGAAGPRAACLAVALIESGRARAVPPGCIPVLQAAGLPPPPLAS